MNRTLKVLLGIVLGLIVIFSYFNTFYSVEYSLEDSTYQYKKPASDDIVIVAIDDESLAEYGRWPWSREKTAEVIEKIESGKPAALGIDIVMSEKTTDVEDKKLVDTVSKYKNIVFPAYGVFRQTQSTDKLELTSLSEPFKALKENVTIGQINVFTDEDGIPRRAPVYFEHNSETISSFDYQLYKMYMQNNNKLPIELSKIPRDKLSRMYIDYNNRYTAVPIISLLEFINNEDTEMYFKDKIVILGPYAVGLNDYYYTPIDKSNQLFGVEIHANVIQNMMEGKYKVYVDDYINIAIILIMAIITLLLFRKIKPIMTTIAAVLLVIIYMLVAKYVYEKGYIIYLIYPIMWITIHYVLAILMRYIEKIKEIREITTMFGKYVSPKIVKEILAKGEGDLKLGGTKRYVTLFFVDIRGFTTMSEKLEPEKVVSVLNEYFENCVDSIFKYDGTLDKFVGDEIMAVFNAPIDLPNHELAAVRAAIDMRDNGRKLHDRVREEFGVELKFGIGLNSGYAIVGNIGTSFKMDYTCIGDAVNTAARLQSISKGGQIIISKSVYDKVKDYIEVTDLDEVKVKGKEEQIKIYQVEGLL
ncbi:MAG: hypothetical protein A2Y24_02680 [Clostridiales bacterium GWE2_32_10]|nr:MAG: hypothetical protein A2Y24_02680 [Clostridiales bacterium GWE2_32_10]HBY20118.1 hypothetical protein [Clostridiales bacterium]